MSQEELRKFLSDNGKKGGASTSLAKRRAARENVKKAHAARRNKK
jgi:hypothetical protein